MLFFVFGCDFSVFLLEITDALTDQIQDLSVGRTPFVFGNIVKFCMKLGIDFDA